jgi:hypothetical protein
MRNHAHETRSGRNELHGKVHVGIHRNHPRSVVYSGAMQQFTMRVPGELIAIAPYGELHVRRPMAHLDVGLQRKQGQRVHRYRIDAHSAGKIREVFHKVGASDGKTVKADGAICTLTLHGTEKNLLVRRIGQANYYTQDLLGCEINGDSDFVRNKVGTKESGVGLPY